MYFKSCKINDSYTIATPVFLSNFVNAKEKLI